MTNLQVGTIQSMEVLRRIQTGYVLKMDQEQALLHNNETNEMLEIYQKVEVFLYQDKNGQIVATTHLPSIQMDTYGWVEVVEVVEDLGAFVNIGITKEILVSKDDLPLFKEVWPDVGDMLYITLGKDQQGRLLALPATEGVFSQIWRLAPVELLNTSVSGRVYLTSREGTAIITDEEYRGFIHHTERKIEPRLGQKVHGRVIEVKDDGTINVSLRPLKREGMSEDSETILAYLQEHGGVIPFSDKSDPEDIRGTFYISKAAFKRALGKLMKEGKVEQKNGETFLKNEPE